MLINATQKEEFRVAIVEGKEICNLDREVKDPDQKKWPQKGDIIVAVVARTEPSLEAAFLDIGSKRHAFLSIKEVHKDFLKTETHGHKTRPHIRDVKVGQNIIVQVEKEERGNKGAFLTSFISLAGPYLVLMPNKQKAGGISRRVEGGERDELKNAINELKVPEGMSVIIRTAGVGRSAEELQWDLDVLLTQWHAIISATQEQRPAPYLIYQESDVIIRALRDNLRPDISEILIDTTEAFEHARNHIAHMRPDFVDRIKLYTGPTPLFNHYQIEHQIESAHAREVKLPNGGAIVIDRTEALVAIDVNSSKATEGSNIEETALNTNLAAAKEIARQLRLRDIGGLVVIDFIDMSSSKNQRAVEDKLREELKTDRARTRMKPISSFGLLEMSRQRLRPSLGDSTQLSCPRCDGQGSIRTVPSLALALLRVIEEEAMKEKIAQLRVQLPTDVATFLFNEKRTALIALEKRYHLSIIILPKPDFLSPHYEISRISKDELGFKEEFSYQLVKKPIKSEENISLSKKGSYEQPVIKPFTQTSIPSASAPSSGSNIIRRIWSAIFGATDSSHLPSMPEPEESTTYSSHSEPSPRSSSSTRGRRSEGRTSHRTRDTRETKEPKRQPEKHPKRRNTPQRAAHQHNHYEADNTVEVIDVLEIVSSPIQDNPPPTTSGKKNTRSKPRPPTRPLRQSPNHPENIQKSASSELPSLLVSVDASEVTEPSAQKTRKNKTGFTKLSDKELEANFIKESDELSQPEKSTESLKQVQSKQSVVSTPKSAKPVVISEEFIKDDLKSEDK